MKFSLTFLLTCISALTSQASAETDHHVLAHGIFSSILNNREFGSTFVKFSEWEAPNGDIYLVPSTDQDSSDVAALGLGYKFVNDDNTVVQSSAHLNSVVEIKEENITSQGFPFHWKKHEETTADDFFPFGSKKFMMIGVNKSSLNSVNTNEWDTELMEQAEGYDGLIDSAGLLHWFDEEDDCNADGRTNKLFDTDHFLFVGVGSVDIEVPSDSYLDGMMNKREHADEPKPSVTVITYYTTTTVTSTHPITITHTVSPSANKEKAFPPVMKSNEEPLYSGTTSVKEPFVFTTSIPEHSHTNNKEELNDLLDVTTTTEVILNEKVPQTTDCSTTSASEATSMAPSLPSDELKSRHTPAPTLTYNTDTESSTVWTVPETWNSYPFSTIEDNFGPISTPVTYMNDTATDEIETATFPATTMSQSSFEQFKTTLYYGNTTTTVYTNSTSKAPEGSIFTRTKSANGTGVSTSLNAANANGYWGSAFALVFAVFSGVIMI